MKKIILVLLIAVLGVASANAQLSFGVKAGFNASTITGLDDMLKEDMDLPGGKYQDNYKPGFQLGVMAQYMFTQEAGIETGLYYSQIGLKKGVKFSEAGYHVDLTATANPSYLQLPVSFLYKFGVGTDLSLYPSAGIYVGYGLGGKYKGKVDTNLPVSELEDYENSEEDFFIDEINRFDAGLTFGLNLQYSKYVIGVGYDLGLLKINKDDMEHGFKDMYNRNFKISLGYFF